MQPEFGMKVTTPPQNRHPIALIDTHISVNSEAPNSPQTRTEGVGNEEGTLHCFSSHLNVGAILPAVYQILFYLLIPPPLFFMLKLQDIVLKFYFKFSLLNSFRTCTDLKSFVVVVLQ